MKKYLAYYENEWPANIAELTAVENKPFVGYLKGEGVLFTVIPEVQPNNEIWYTSSDESIVTPYMTGVFGANIVSNTYENGKGVITFDGDVTSIGERAFYYSPNLTSIVIPDGVTSIGLSAFSDCFGLTSITIPNSVINIANNALLASGIYNNVLKWEDKKVLYIDNCLVKAKDKHQAYTIKENTRLIASNAFYGCYSLTSITIPNSVTSIGEEAFASCSSLTSITYEGTVEQWNTITRGEYWNSGIQATYVQCSDGQVTL